VTERQIDLQSTLEEAILACRDERQLWDLLDQQSFVAAPSARLDAYLRKYIEHPVPFLTAKILRVYRHTGSEDRDIQKAAASYLNVDAYDEEWYDETINSIGWANELLIEGSDSPLVAAYREFLQQVEEGGHQELLEFCRGYER
jgi:hypothetical protein